jgi:uncharacterized protein
MTVPLSARTISGVPVLIGVPPRSDGPLPVVLWHHGFTADSLAHAGELERCAEAGFLAIGVDAVGHGARTDHDRGARIAASPDGALSVMMDIVDDTLSELPTLIDTLARDFAIDRSRVSIVGISMGAFLVYRAIVTGLPVRAAVALLGSPDWPRDAPSGRQLTAFRDVALLSVTAEHDVSVPPAPAKALHAALRDAYPEADLQHHELRGAGHLTSAAEWSEAMQMTLGWLGRHG